MKTEFNKTAHGLLFETRIPINDQGECRTLTTMKRWCGDIVTYAGRALIYGVDGGTVTEMKITGVQYELARAPAGTRATKKALWAQHKKAVEDFLQN